MTMEIKTCEQYVLLQLFEQQDENDRILADNRKLRELIEDQRNELADVEKRLNSAMANAIRDAGRKAILGEAIDGETYRARVKDYKGDIVPYEAWVVEAIKYEEVPSNVSLADFFHTFEPELRALYAKRLNEEGFHPVDGGAEDGN